MELDAAKATTHVLQIGGAMAMSTAGLPDHGMGVVKIVSVSFIRTQVQDVIFVRDGNHCEPGGFHQRRRHAKHFCYQGQGERYRREGSKVMRTAR